ncbi:MAG TPA: hypothetical protein VEC06_04615 [Paucimonas sp.]|nr:hypothetical protein [Paucimonas sp.]
MRFTVSTELMLLGAALVAFLGVLVYVFSLKSKEKRERRNTKAISVALVDYFRRTGVEVSVGCVKSHGSDRYTAFIESEPMKRFRLSHIIEMTLREQVAKNCGLELDKVYWRFPIKEVAQNPAAAVAKAQEAVKAAEGVDDYINEGLVNYRDLPKLEVTEIPWEKFEEAAAVEPAEKAEPKQDTADSPDKA